MTMVSHTRGPSTVGVPYPLSEMVRDAYLLAEKGEDTITLVGGDGDYVPPVRTLVEDGFTVHVVFWAHASQELQDVASDFIELDSHFSYLALS